MNLNECIILGGHRLEQVGDKSPDETKLQCAKCDLIAYEHPNDISLESLAMRQRGSNYHFTQHL